MSHRCPATGCTEILEEQWKFMCGPHWHLIPAELQKTLNRRDLSELVRQLTIEGAIAAVERAEFGGRLL